jgi:two-component system, chemotaxis family, protein-glutamate methylesterase/glutaminase
MHGRHIHCVARRLMPPLSTANGVRDIVVIGASAGGVGALREIIQGLPSRFPAAVFIVLHLSPERPSVLGPLLDQLGPLRVRTAEDGDPIEPGTVYVAPPDMHMTLQGGRVHVAFGPPQDRHRPSIDVLFRSAAHEFGSRVVGVVLTGFLSDGTAGLRSIKQQGGTTLVQDPQSAAHRGMPDSALRSGQIDHIVPLADIAGVLVRLTQATPRPPPATPNGVLQFDTDADLGQVGKLEPVAVPSSFLCPDCGGALWEMRADEPPRFRCRVGHGYSIESLVASQQPYVERALWEAARSLEDRAALFRRMAGSWRERDAEAVVEHFARTAEQSAANAAVIRSLLGLPEERGS